MRKKKLLAFAMILIVMFNLVSCGNTSAGGKTDQVNTDQTGQENAVQKKAGAFPGTTDEDTVVLDITTEPVEMN